MFGRRVIERRPLEGERNEARAEDGILERLIEPKVLESEQHRGSPK